MFKKFIAMMMIFAITTVSANASTASGLKAAFDELNYTLEVEWDQKDQAFYNNQMKAFRTVIGDLQAQGLSNAELIEFVKSEVKNEKVARDLETAFNMISLNKMSSAEASRYMMETMQRSYNNGASWNGSAAGVIGGLVIIAVIVGVLVATGAASAIANTQCGYSAYHCGTSCSGLNCDANYCCWN